MLVGIELGHRVDHVELGIRAELIEQELGLLAPERPDLDQPTRLGGAQYRSDGLFPERKHCFHPSIDDHFVLRRKLGHGGWDVSQMAR